MGKGLKKANGDDEHYTMIPNRLIRSVHLDANDKAIFCCIASCNPSFPTFDNFTDWTGIQNRSVITRSLIKLEITGSIKRYKVGRQIYYTHFWNGNVALPKGARLVTYGYHIGNLALLESVTRRYSKKNKEKDPYKNCADAPETEAEIGALIDQELGLAGDPGKDSGKERTFAELTQEALNRRTA